MSDNAARLLKLAFAEFPDLTAPEFEVVRAAAVGEAADLMQWTPSTPKPKGKKRKEKTFNPGGGPLRSALVTWLCTDARAKRLVHRKGLGIANATLDTELDLERAEVPFFFGLHNCRLPGLNAERATLGDTLFLKSCRVDGEVCLLGATISGQLRCQGARIFNRTGDALDADHATIGNNVYLSKGFRAVGQVCLLGAKIAGQLDCRGGSFLNRNGYALNADRATIGNNVYLSEGFLGMGQVRLLGAQIPGHLICKAGRFLNRKGDALSADGAAIGDSVHLSEGFRAVGRVCLPGAKITGQLDCEGGSFRVKEADKIALNMECATILDSVILDAKTVHGAIDISRAAISSGLRMLSPALATASLNLSGAKVGLLLDARDSWPEQGKLQLDGFHYESIIHLSPMTAKKRLDWLGRQPQDKFLPQPYEQLAAFFQRAGHDSEAKDVRIAKEWAHQRHFKNPFKRAWWFLKWATIGFGYRPQRAIYLLLILIAIGSTVYWRNMESMTPSVSYHYNATDASDVKGNFIASNYPDLNTLLYSTDVALPIVDLQQERYWMPNSDTANGRLLWWFNWLEVLTGWFLASMGIAGATGIIRKD